MEKKSRRPIAEHTRTLQKAVEVGKISQDESNLITTFISHTSVKKGGRGLSDDRKKSIPHALLAMRDYMDVGYDAVNADQVYAAIERYKEEANHAAGTQQLYLVTFKQFLTWMIEDERNTVLKPARIAKIGTTMPVALKTEKDILVGDELERIYTAMKSTRDRTFIEVLYDTMGRASEVCKLQWHQIEFYDKYAVITLQSKTDKARKIPLYTSHITVKLWKHQYPNGAKPDDYVFFGRGNTKKPMIYGTALAMVKDAAKRAGIEKNVTPHTFRHTKITDLLREGTPEQTVKMMAWGTITTDMLKVYAHLTPQDAVNEMNRRRGIESTHNTNPLADIVTPAQCPRCGNINSKANPYCSICGSAMADTGTNEHSRLKSQLEQEPMYSEYVRRHEQLKDEMMRKYGESPI
jgi:site-specific recombinase XerD